MKNRMMKRMMNHLKRLHRMNLRVLYGEENHRKEVSGRLQREIKDKKPCVYVCVCVCVGVCVCA